MRPCASPKNEASSITEFLNHLILSHGCPYTAIFDHGTEFCNQVCPHTHSYIQSFTTSNELDGKNHNPSSLKFSDPLESS